MLRKYLLLKEAKTKQKQSCELQGSAVYAVQPQKKTVAEGTTCQSLDYD